MPKTALSRENLARQRIEYYPELKYQGGNVMCTVCHKSVDFKNKSNFDRHVSSKQHTSKKRGVSGHAFHIDLIKFIISCNIPWKQVNRPQFKGFLEKYTSHTVPDESSLRKTYLPKICDDYLQKIQEELKEKYICLSVDETTDTTGRHIVNIVLWGLSNGSATEPRLVSSKEVSSTNHTTICEQVDRSLQWLWGDPVAHKNNFVLFVTDGANYMRKAGTKLTEKYPKIIHVTCVAHNLHRVAEKVRECFGEVDHLISNIKKIFLKAPTRIKIFQETLPNVPLPPQPVTTRWVTWLQAALYYNQYFYQLQEVISKFNPQDASSVRHTQRLLQSSTLKLDLEYIEKNFSILVNKLKVLETKGMSVAVALTHVEEIFDKLETATGVKGLTVNHKLNEVFHKNTGYQHLKLLLEDNSLPPFLEYAPIVSVDVERTFSVLKWIFSSRRHNLTADNLERLMIVYHELAL